jgi:hypothetical protein
LEAARKARGLLTIDTHHSNDISSLSAKDLTSLVKDQQKFVEEVTSLALESIEVQLSLDTRSLGMNMQKLKAGERFKVEAELRKELSETKSCFLTLYNDNPYSELDED